MNFYVRGAGDPTPVLRSIPSVMGRLDPNLPIEDLKTLPQQVRENVFLDRMIGTLSASFAMLATLLAAVGLYAVLAHHVAARTIEIGIRMAMGADRRAIEGLIITQALRLVAIGTAIGLATAAIASPALIVQLYGVSPYDPGTYGLVTAVFIGVGLCASWVPARRAARVDPLASLNAA